MIYRGYLRYSFDEKKHGDSYSYMKCLNMCSAHVVIVYSPHSIPSYTQDEVASRDANIRQLEEKCEQLEAQVSPTFYISCDTLGQFNVTVPVYTWGCAY